MSSASISNATALPCAWMEHRARSKPFSDDRAAWAARASAADSYSTTKLPFARMLIKPPLFRPAPSSSREDLDGSYDGRLPAFLLHHHYRVFTRAPRELGESGDGFFAARAENRAGRGRAPPGGLPCPFRGIPARCPHKPIRGSFRVSCPASRNTGHTTRNTPNPCRTPWLWAASA